LEATLRITFTFTPAEAAMLLSAPLSISQNMWFEEDDGFFDDLVGASRGIFTVPRMFAGGSSTIDFRPPSFVTSLRPHIYSGEGDEAEFKGSIAKGFFSDTDTGEIWLNEPTPPAGQAGGVLRGPRVGSPGVTYTTLAAAPRADAPAFANLRIYHVTSDGTSLTVNGFNNSGFTLALASDDLLLHPTEDGEPTQFDPSVTFSDQYANGATTVGTLSGTGNVWAARDLSGDTWLSSWAYTTNPPVLPGDGESVTVFPEELSEGGEALWLNFMMGSSGTVSFLIAGGSGGSGGSIGDFVWEDVNQDGIQDPGEPGLGRVEVNLLDEFGGWIDSTTTDVSGYDVFFGLQPGTYRIKFVAHSGYSFSLQDQGTDDTLDSDVDAAGLTAVLSLAFNENRTNVDAGLTSTGSGGSGGSGGSLAALSDTGDSGSEEARGKSSLAALGADDGNSNGLGLEGLDALFALLADKEDDARLLRSVGWRSRK
jgi:hypothetical protein